MFYFQALFSDSLFEFFGIEFELGSELYWGKFSEYVADGAAYAALVNPYAIAIRAAGFDTVPLYIAMQSMRVIAKLCAFPPVCAYPPIPSCAFPQVRKASTPARPSAAGMTRQSPAFRRMSAAGGSRSSRPRTLA